MIRTNLMTKKSRYVNVYCNVPQRLSKICRATLINDRTLSMQEGAGRFIKRGMK